VSPRFELFEPHWTLVDARDRCVRCGVFSRPVWTWFIEPTTYTRVYCEGCVVDLLLDDESGS